MKIAGIYLAGGNSKRMHTQQSKLTLPVGNRSLGSLALATILQAELDAVFVIIQEKDDALWLLKDIGTYEKYTIIRCPTAHLGQAETIRCGVQIAKDHKMDAVMIFLADQPLITLQMIHQMINALKTEPTKKFIAATYKATLYPPVLLKKELFNTLLTLTGDRGAKAILTGPLRTFGIRLPFHDPLLFFDIDTKSDYQHFLQIKKATKKC